MKKTFICTVCGYMHEGTEAPAECPVCHVKADKFKGFNGAALKGTKTETNLMAAFAGESQARMKYDYYAGKARKDGYEQIAALFEETAINERMHAKLWFKLLHNAGIPSTEENLKDAADGENYEWICTRQWLRTLWTRVSQNWQLSSAALVLSRRSTRSVIASC